MSFVGMCLHFWCVPLCWWWSHNWERVRLCVNTRSRHGHTHAQRDKTFNNVRHEVSSLFISLSISSPINKVDVYCPHTYSQWLLSLMYTGHVKGTSLKRWSYKHYTHVCRHHSTNISKTNLYIFIICLSQYLKVWFVFSLSVFNSHKFLNHTNLTLVRHIKVNGTIVLLWGSH